MYKLEPECKMENTNRRDETAKQNAAEADCTTTTNWGRSNSFQSNWLDIVYVPDTISHIKRTYITAVLHRIKAVSYR